MNKREKVLLWSSNIWSLGAGLLGPLFAVFTQNIGGDVLSITWVWGAYLVSMGVFIIIIGKVSDRFHNKSRLALIGYALNALLTFGYLLVHTPYELFLVQVGLGFAAALASSTWSALYDQYSGGGDKDGWIWGLASGFEKIATGIGVVIGGYIVAIYSFQTLFVIMGISQILALIVQTRFVSRK